MEPLLWIGGYLIAGGLAFRFVYLRSVRPDDYGEALLLVVLWPLWMMVMPLALLSRPFPKPLRERYADEYRELEETR